jgi:hypothetical protein
MVIYLFIYTYVSIHVSCENHGFRYLLVAKDPDRFGWFVTLLFFLNYESLFALVFILALVG